VRLTYLSVYDRSVVSPRSNELCESLQFPQDLTIRLSYRHLPPSPPDFRFVRYYKLSLLLDGRLVHFQILMNLYTVPNVTQKRTDLYDGG
jgi:hypothetical protein